MNLRPLGTVCAVLLTFSAASAHQPSAPVSSPKPIRHPAVLSNKLHRPANSSSHVSSAACNRRAAGPGTPGALGPNGASASQTLVAIPIGGGNVATATQQQQITEACAHRRH
jgi:hypothetical protein